MKPVFHRGESLRVPAETAVDGSGRIFAVAHYRMTDMRHVRPYLVRPACVQYYFDAAKTVMLVRHKVFRLYGDVPRLSDVAYIHPAFFLRL